MKNRDFLLVVVFFILVAAPLISMPQMAFAVVFVVNSAGNSQADANALADAILGPGISRSGNAVLIGNSNQQGSFSGGTTAVGFNSGIVLFTGDNASSIPGQNARCDPGETLASPSGISDCDDLNTGVGTGGDADLPCGGALGTNDVNSLEFNFTTPGGDLAFKYAFGTEEYIDYVNSNFNDCFVLLVDGVNQAIIPGSVNDPVTVNNVNPGNNSGFYVNNVDNTGGYADSTTLGMHLDGRTTVLTTKTVNLAAGIHNLKIVVGDAADDALDASVFIQAGSVALALPTVSINDVAQNEGNSGTTSFNFTVTRSGNTTGASSVDFATADGTASLTSDYSTESGTLEFAAGETTKTVTVDVDGDTNVEPDETFFVNLSNCISCNIVDGQGLGTILNDDFAPGVPDISIDDVSLTEGNSGTKNFNFTLTRSGDISGASSVDFDTADGTATVADSDYVATNGTVNFAAGETTKTVTVVVNGDTTVEPDETFFVNLSNCVGCDFDDQGHGTILNDDVVPGDVDQDSVPDTIDNCPTVFNPDQLDSDGDGIGDACEQALVVGGEILGIDATALFMAGAFANAFWILPVMAAIGAALASALSIKRWKKFD